MMANLMAIGFMNGHGHEYGASLRMLLGKGIREFKEGLGERDRKDYEEVLRNVYLIVLQEEPEPDDLVERPEEELFRKPHGVKV